MTFTLASEKRLASVALVLGLSLGCSSAAPRGHDAPSGAAQGPEPIAQGLADAGKPVKPTAGDASPGSGDGGAAASEAGTVAAGGDGGAPSVTLSNGSLVVGGTPIFPFGGDLQYFRVRDPGFDAATTWAMWESSLDLMTAAGMNLVTTYVPWDYHNTASGTWDFTGAKDLGHFLSLACGKGFKVVLKPGPLITAEWPKGWGTYGAVPAWWKAANPGSMIRKSDGTIWTYSPTGDATQQQPTYLDPTYLAAVADYYAHVLPIAAPYVGSCLVGIQVDNETNLYWGNRFGDVDYSPAAIAFYQSWLQAQYASIAALNALYGTTYASFADVVAPSSVPSDTSGNPAAADWYWAGQAYVSAYLAKLEGLLAQDGFGPDKLLHFTNDSPFAVAYGTIQIQNALLHDPATKDPFGVPSLDLYPKQDPTSGALQDQPFQSDYFTSEWELRHAKGAAPSGFVYAAELQGGFFSYPVLGAPNVQAQATDQLLARTSGHGLRGGSFYVVRGGINADGSDYDYEAAIGADGSLRPRYAVMQKWGTFFQNYGLDLQTAIEVRNSVAILDNAAYAAPQGGIDDNMQLLHTQEQPALFGWLQNAGIDAAILDAQSIDLAELSTYAVVMFQNPDYVDDATSQMLASYVQGGGTLVNFLWEGEYDQDFQTSAASRFFSTSLFPAQADGSWLWATNTARTGTFNATLPSGLSGQLTSAWYESYWTDPTGALMPFAWERTAPLGTNGRIMGYVAQDSLGKRAFLGTNVYSLYNRENYYTLDPTTLTQDAALAQWLVGLGGEAPIVSIGPQELVWARQSAARTYLFVVDDSGTAGTQTIQVGNASRLGIDPSATYDVTELLTQVDLGTMSGQTLLSGGIPVALGAYGTAVVGITKQ